MANLIASSSGPPRRLPSGFVRQRRGSVMRIGAILKRWFDTLATLLLAWHERQRERRALTVAFEGQQLVVREFRLAGAAAQQNVRAGQTISDELVRMAR